MAILLLCFTSSSYAADWFVRPLGSGIVIKNGRSYETAWEGLDSVVWGDDGVNSGDNLYICGTFFTSKSLTVGASGANDSQRIIIRGDYPHDPGVIYSIAYKLKPTDWQPVGHGVYRIPQFTGGSGTYYIYEQDGKTVHLSRRTDYFPRQVEKISDPERVDLEQDTITVTGNWPTGMKIVLQYAMPVPLNKNTDYYVINLGNNRIQLSLTPGGPPIDLKKKGGHFIIGRALTDSELAIFTDGFYWDDGPHSAHIYYKTVSGKSPKDLQCYATHGSKNIDVQGYSYITISNLVTFGEIGLKNANYINIDKVKIYNTAWGIRLEGECNYTNITNCAIDNVCEGIYAYSGGSGKVSNNCIIKNNKITNVVPYTFGYVKDQHAIAFQNGINNKAYGNVIETAATGLTVYVSSSFAPSCSFEAYNNFVKDIYGHDIGSANWRSSGNILVDPRYDFAKMASVGQAIKNRTTGATGTIKAITTTLNNNDTLITSMKGGSRSAWKRDDVWQTAKATGHGFALDFHGPVKGCETEVKFYNNIVKDVDYGGVRINNALAIPTAKTFVYNNIINNVGCGIHIGGNGVAYNVTNLIINNNIISNVRDCGLKIMEPGIFNISGRLGSNSFLIDHNCYFIPSDKSLQGRWFKYFGTNNFNNVSWSDWQVAIREKVKGNETHTIRTDPKFLNTSGKYSQPTDFRLADDSPAREAGYPWKGIDRDFGGLAFHKTRPSMGAWSWQGRTSRLDLPKKEKDEYPGSSSSTNGK